jgi:hypothetical protein
MVARQRNGFHPVFAYFSFALNMNMLWFAAIKAEKEQPIWA